jgi:hypothetical protein
MKTPTFLYHRTDAPVLIDATEVAEYTARGYQDTPDFGPVSPREAKEEEARALGIKVDGRWSDKRLDEAIAAAK